MIFEAIGTKWEIIIDRHTTAEKEEKLSKEIISRIEVFDKNYSRFRNDSLVTTMSKKTGNYILPEDAKKMFDRYKKIYEMTKGAVTPLIGRLMEETGYDSSYSFNTKKLNPVPLWEDVIQYDHPDLVIKRPVLLDLGAGGKGYIVDIIGEIITNFGIDSYMINAGGDILYSNARTEKLRVGLEDPTDRDKAIGIAEIINESICGSSGSRRKWGDFHHIMDPYKLESTKGILSTWAIAKTAMDADLISTALFFKSGTELLNDIKFEYLVLYEDRSIDRSNSFPGELFIEKNK